MILRRESQKIHIAAIIDVAVILLRADKRLAGEEGVGNSRRRRSLYSLPAGDIAGFITANALFAGHGGERRKSK